MADDRLTSRPHMDIVARPQLSERIPGQGEFAHQLHRSWVKHLGCDRTAESGDQLRRGAVPVPAELLLAVIQEEITKPVSPDREVG